MHTEQCRIFDRSFDESGNISKSERFESVEYACTTAMVKQKHGIKAQEEEKKRWFKIKLYQLLNPGV